MNSETDEQYYGCSNEERYSQAKMEYYLYENEFKKFKRKVDKMASTPGGIFAIADESKSSDFGKNTIESIKREIHEYENREDLTHSWLMKRMEHYKQNVHDFYGRGQYHEFNEKIKEFDAIYDELINTIKD